MVIAIFRGRLSVIIPVPANFRTEDQVGMRTIVDAQGQSVDVLLRTGTVPEPATIQSELPAPQQSLIASSKYWLMPMVSTSTASVKRSLGIEPVGLEDVVELSEIA